MRADGKNHRRRVVTLKLDEISAVDRPAQPDARMAIMKRAEAVAKLKPHAGESEADFVSRFMADSAMRAEYPDQKQRAAVAYSDFKQRVAKMDDDPLSLMAATADDLEKVDFNAEQRRHLASSGIAMPDGSFPIRNRQDLMNAIHAWGRANPGDRAKVAAHIRARAKALGLSDLLPQGEGPLASALSKGTDQASDNPINDMDEKQLLAKVNEQLAAEQKRATRLEKLAELNDAQRAIFAKLDSPGQDQFLALTPEMRQAEVRKAADADSVVYTALNGETFRKSDDPRLVRMAKDRDEDRKARIEAEATAKTERLAKRAQSELPNLPGDEGTKVALLNAVDGLPEAQRLKVSELLKAANDTMAQAFSLSGTSLPTEPAGPEAEIEKLAEEIRKSQPKLSPEQAWVKAVESPKGRRLYAEIDRNRS